MSFEAAMLASGLRPRDVVPDGRWRRCATEDHPRKRNGAYVLHSDGRGYWKNWATDQNANAWRDETATHAAPIDPQRLRSLRESEHAARVRAIHAARRIWQDSAPLRGLHPYLEKKGLSPLGCAGLRVNSGLLVCALPVPGAVRAAGAAAVVAALAAFLPLLVVGMRAGRRAKNIPVAERVSGASQ